MNNEYTEKLNDDILIEGLPAISIDNENYLLYSPYKKVFVKARHNVLRDSENIKNLKERGIFDFPPLQKNHSKRIVLTVTKKCNLFCQYCFANSGPHANEEMAPRTAVGIIEALLSSYNLERIHFTGGEPTLNFEAIKDVVLYLEKSKIKPLPIFYITTNGIMKGNVLEWLIDKEFAFSISWDGLEEKLNTSQRSYISGRKSEEKTRETILRVSKSNLPSRVRIAVSNLNLPYLYESVEWLVENGVKFIHIDPVVPDGRGATFLSKYLMKSEDFINEFFRVLEYAKNKNIWILNSALANLYTPKDFYCTSIRDKVDHFNPDGSISYCYRVQSLEDKLANYLVCGRSDENNGIKIDEEKSVMLSSINISQYAECKNYYLKNFYSGGCPYRNFAATNSWNKIDVTAYDASNEIYKQAILHIYKRALEGKPSALEGYVYFYKNLIRENTIVESNIDQPKYDFRINGPCSIELISIPMTTLNHSIDIDACDICI